MVLNLGPLAPDATALTTRQSFLGSSCFSIKFNSTLAESEPKQGRQRWCWKRQEMLFDAEKLWQTWFRFWSRTRWEKKFSLSFEKLFFFKMMPKRDGSACWRFFCRRPCLSKPVIALSSSAKVIFFYLSAMTPNNLRKAGSHIRGEIKRSVFRKKLEWLNISALAMVIHELKNLGAAKHNW